MKKYNTPEMNVSMFNCETVATSEDNRTASEYALDGGATGTAAINIYSYETIRENITMSY